MKELIILLVLLLVGIVANAQPTLESTLDMQTEIIDSLQQTIQEQDELITHLKSSSVKVEVPTTQLLAICSLNSLFILIGILAAAFTKRYVFGIVIKKRTDSYEN
jgi:hypothetical protein